MNSQALFGISALMSFPAFGAVPGELELNVLSKLRFAPGLALNAVGVEVFKLLFDLSFTLHDFEPP